MLSKEEYYVIVTSSINNILTCININDNKKIEFNINEIDELTIEEIHQFPQSLHKVQVIGA